MFSSCPGCFGTPAASQYSAAVIWIHGLSGDANTYHCAGTASIASAGAASSTLSLTPWFGDEQIRLSEWGGSGAAKNVSVFWSSSRWLSGGDNSPSPSRFTTSFDALDDLVACLAAGFLNLERVTVVGFSAGAQLSSRWAFFSDRVSSSGAHGGGGLRGNGRGGGEDDMNARRSVGSGGKIASADRATHGRSLHVRAVVSDPSSYLYLDGRRPSSACSPPRNTGDAWACSQFATPSAEASCDDTYDDYKYGLAHLEQQTSNLYLATRYAANASALEAAVAAFPHRDVRYLLGTQDACNCNAEAYANDAGCYPDGVAASGCSPNAHGAALHGHGCCDTYPDSTSENALSVTCASNLQGSNRLQRGRNFLSYINELAPEAAPTVASFVGGHNASAMIFSAELASWAFALP